LAGSKTWTITSYIFENETEKLHNMPSYQADSTKNETEETKLITSIDDDKSNRYKYVTIAAAVLVLGLVTGTSSSSIGSLLLHQDNTDADTVKVMAAVEGNNPDAYCLSRTGSVCQRYGGLGQGNCCFGLICGLQGRPNGFTTCY